jgi:hypothetical protein
LENFAVEQKNLGWEHSKWYFENVFEHLGTRNYSIDGFKKMSF